MGTRCSFSVLVASLAVLCSPDSHGQAGISSAATEEEPASSTFEFDVPAGPVGHIIIELSQLTGVPILVDDRVSKMASLGVTGSNTLSEALEKVTNGLPAAIQRLPAGYNVVFVDTPTRDLSPTINDSAPSLNVQRNNDLHLRPIKVFGFAKAMTNAIALKRASVGVGENIVAEDIGRYPELNLAESLQRIPGITISRQRGEGSEISLRGLNSGFTRVQLNGMPWIINSGRSRGFQFNALSSELFSKISVKKSYDVSLNEGGIGGTIQLSTPAPFDFEDKTLVLSGHLGTNSNSNNTDDRLYGLWTNQIDTEHGKFGFLISSAWSERTSEGQDASTFRYRAVPISPDIVADLDPALAADFSAGNVFIPRGNRYRVSSEEQSRLGVTYGLQWAPDDMLEFNVSGVYGAYDVDRTANNIQTRGQSSLPISDAFLVDGTVFGPSSITQASVNDAFELEYARFEDAVIGSESTLSLLESEFSLLSASVDWKLPSGGQVHGFVGRSRSSSTSREDKVYLETVAELEIDYRGGNRLNPTLNYGGDQDLVDVDVWRAHEIDLDDSRTQHKMHFGRLEFSFPVDDACTIHSGVNLQSYASPSSRARVSNLLRNAFETGALDDDISELGVVFTDHEREDWVGVDVQNALDHFGAALGARPDLIPDFGFEEDAWAVFSRMRWTPEAIPIEAELGLRYVGLERRVSDATLTVNGEIVDQSDRDIKHYREDILPAATLKYEPVPDLVFRVSASKNITYPQIAAINPSTVLRTLNFQDAIIGDVDLRPFQAVNLDVYAERYFPGGLVYLGYYRKDLEDYISLTATEAPYSQLGLSETFLQPDQTGDTLFAVSRYSNNQNTLLEGWEMGVQSELGKIHPALTGWGLVANMTYADGDFTYTGVETEEAVIASFPGLSDYTANFSVFYETDRFGLRTAVAYRSDYLTNIEPGLRDEDSRGQLSSTFVDAAGYFQVTQKAKLTVDLLNILEETELAYSDSLERLTERRDSGRTLLVGLQYQF